MKTPYPYIYFGVLIAITLVFVFIAIRRSVKRVQTAFYIVAAVSACGAVGAVIGLASVNSGSAYILALFFVALVVHTTVRFAGIRRGSKKSQTVFYIVTAVLACGIVAALIRLAFANSHAAGTLTTLFMLAGGIAVSIEQIRKYRNVGLT